MESRLHVGQHDLSEGTVFSWPGQLRPGDVPDEDSYPPEIIMSLVAKIKNYRFGHGFAWTYCKFSDSGRDLYLPQLQRVQAFI